MRPPTTDPMTIPAIAPPDRPLWLMLLYGPETPAMEDEATEMSEDTEDAMTEDGTDVGPPEGLEMDEIWEGDKVNPQVDISVLLLRQHAVTSFPPAGLQWPHNRAVF